MFVSALHTAALLLCALAQPDGQIAYLAEDSAGARQVHLLDLADGAARRVGPGPDDQAPVWSPDGARLAFSARVPGRPGRTIHVTPADGGEPQTLDTGFVYNTAPRWTIDARRLAIQAGPTPALDRQQLVVCPAAGGECEVWAGGQEGLLTPDWLTGIELMFALDPDQEFEWQGVDTQSFVQEAMGPGVLLAVGLMAEGSTRRTELLLCTPSYTLPVLRLLNSDSAPYVEWNMRPDARARQFVFESNAGGDRELYLLGRRGLSNISNHRAADWNPVWSPSGDWLAFESFRSGQRGLHVVYARTGRVYPLAAETGAQCWAPTWSPDEAWVAYVCNAGGQSDLYARQFEGEQTVRLTNSAAAEWAPAWRPEPD